MTMQKYANIILFALIIYDNNIFLYIIFYLVNTSIDSIFFHIFK